MQVPLQPTRVAAVQSSRLGLVVLGYEAFVLKTRNKKHSRLGISIKLLNSPTKQNGYTFVLSLGMNKIIAGSELN